MRIDGIGAAYRVGGREGAEAITPGRIGGGGAESGGSDRGGIGSIGGIEGIGSAGGGAQSETTKGSFGEALASALGQVNGLQAEADTQAQLVATGEAQDLHTAAIAMERAELALQATVQITQKAIDAYKEVSRMQV